MAAHSAGQQVVNTEFLPNRNDLVQFRFTKLFLTHASKTLCEEARGRHGHMLHDSPSMLRMH